MKRRDFIKLSIAASAIAPIIKGCKPKRVIKGSIVGASSNIGHLLRDKHFDKPIEIIEKDVVIIGGGVSGLSAARHLQRSGINDFVVMDLEKAMGGNAASGTNDISPYPWGAHYVPIPNNNLTEYLEFLKESNVIVGQDDKGLPIYNDYHLCFDPHERLYINGRWQEGIIPSFGVPEKERKQIQSFMEMMDKFRTAKGSDGRDAFSIPVDSSSKDPLFTTLDKLTMKEWLLQHKLDSEYLHWYTNYCTRDDFGTDYSRISAWVGIHYFAARKGKGANAEHQDVLTWPEGNNFLVKKLSDKTIDRFLNNVLATNVSIVEDKVRITYLDVPRSKLKAIDAKFAVVCTPQFINARLFPSEKERTQLIKEKLSYSTWMVANLKVKDLIERQGVPLSWDNVLYGSSSLGYVHAGQQLLKQKVKNASSNITYYLPLTSATASTGMRKEAQKRTHAQWTESIVEDMKMAHPNIEDAIEEANVMIWGHAMAEPLPGSIHGEARQKLQEPINDQVYFAHTDLAGISIFEEGFYQGLNAAKEVAKKLKA